MIFAMRKPAKWKWFVWGKHPSIEDFIMAGTQTPLFQRFTKWIDNGFTKFSPGSKLRSRHCSWRFWTHGDKGQVVCGVVRNSCDVDGRSFPLIYIGTGDLPEWSENCSLLPFVFESMWKEFEYTASARFDTHQQLIDSLQLIQQPVADWKKHQQRIHDKVEMSYAFNRDDACDNRKRLLTLDCKVPENLPYDMHFCKHLMIASGSLSPLAVFISEINEKIAVVVFNHTLTPADFCWLWSRGQTGQTLPAPNSIG